MEHQLRPTAAQVIVLKQRAVRRQQAARFIQAQSYILQRPFQLFAAVALLLELRPLGQQAGIEGLRGFGLPGRRQLVQTRRRFLLHGLD